MRKRVALTVVILLCVAATLTACSEDLPVAVPESGYTVSGCVTADDSPLEGVTVLVNGEKETSTNAYGIYTVSGLEYGSVVAFDKDGFSFSPDSYTVSATAYDMNVLAFPEAPADTDEDGTSDDETDDETGDGTGDTSDGDDVDEDADSPAGDAVELDAPSGFFLAYTASGALALGFSVDADAESMTLRVDCPTGTLVSTSEVADGEFVFDGFSCPFGIETDSDGTVSVTADITAIVSVAGGEFSVTVTVSAADAEPVESAPFFCAVAEGAPSVHSLSLQDGTLTWEAAFLPENTTFAVLVNGVKVAESVACLADMSDLLSSLPEGATVCVAALCEGKVVAVSDAFPLDGHTAT